MTIDVGYFIESNAFIGRPCITVFNRISENVRCTDRNRVGTQGFSTVHRHLAGARVNERGVEKTQVIVPRKVVKPCVDVWTFKINENRLPYYVAFRLQRPNRAKVERIQFSAVPQRTIYIVVVKCTRVFIVYFFYHMNSINQMPIANYFPQFAFVSLVSNIPILVRTVIILLQWKICNCFVLTKPSSKNLFYKQLL